MNGWLAGVEAELQQRHLLKPGQAAVVAVSGGVDSMVLLTVLHRLRARHGWRLCVAHLNHGLRGSESDADEALVRAAAARWDLPLIAGRAEVRTWASQRGLSLEMAARRLRHEFLAETAQAHRASTIALGHHADDQVELFFLRLLRGAGARGLAGMRWSNPSPVDLRTTLIRPLLHCSRADILRFARAEKVPFREDATNAAVDILRNRVRHELLPQLTQDYQPALRTVILREIEILGAQAELLDKLSEAWRKRSKSGNGRSFGRLNPAVQRQVLREELIELGIEPEFDRVEQLRLTPGKPITVNPGFRVSHDGKGRVRAAKPHGPPALFPAGESALRLHGRQGAGRFNGLAWRWKIEPAREERRPRFGSAREWFDADKVGACAVLRHWRPGDRFQPSGMPKPVKLQDLLTNQKVPRSQRHRLVVATTVNGEIWWVEGLRIAEKFKLRSESRRRLRWSWRR